MRALQIFGMLHTLGKLLHLKLLLQALMALSESEVLFAAFGSMRQQRDIEDSLIVD